MIVISMVLVVVGFVTLMLGVLDYGEEPLYFIYASIGSCILAGVFLIAGVLRSRPSRKAAPVPATESPVGAGWPGADVDTTQTLPREDTGPQPPAASPPPPPAPPPPGDRPADTGPWRPKPTGASPTPPSPPAPTGRGAARPRGPGDSDAADAPDASAGAAGEPAADASAPQDPGERPIGGEPGPAEAPPTDEPGPAEAPPADEPGPAEATAADEPGPAEATAAGEPATAEQPGDAEAQAPAEEDSTGPAAATGAQPEDTAPAEGQQAAPSDEPTPGPAARGRPAKKAATGAKKMAKKATAKAASPGAAKKTAAKKAAPPGAKSTAAKATTQPPTPQRSAAAKGETRRIAEALNGVEGCGLAQHRSLAQRFGTYDELLAASVKDIADVAGVSEALAQRIHERLHG